METPLRDSLINLTRSYPRLPRALSRTLEGLLGFHGVNEIYQALPPETGPEDFFDRVLEVMNVRYTVLTHRPNPIPATGPVLILANHPFGGLDGLLLGSLVSRVRADSKFLVNRLLLNLPEMAPRIIPVDVFGGANATRGNLQGMRESLKYLREGGCLATFPAGEVAHWGTGLQVRESPWSPHLASLAKKTQATIIPVYFPGTNSLPFQALGLLHERLRTLLLPRELVVKRDASLLAVVGEPIPAVRLNRFRTPEEATAFLRFQTFLLRGRIGKPTRGFLQALGARTPSPEKAQVWERAVEPPEPPERLEQEVRQLNAESLLVDQGRFQVFCARRSEIPTLVREIGRLRETTFREVNEGTGKATDLDGFDDYYWHLFLWDSRDSRVAGAYRLGLSKEILPVYGQKGFYTHTLFRMKAEFLKKLGPCMELGRSFIVSDYQKKHASLVMLWKGIGTFVLRHPEVRNLFGPVSIDKEYQALSRDIMVQFLKSQKGARELASWVRPRNPLSKGPLNHEEKDVLNRIVDDIDEVSALISAVEESGKGVPVLLKHYVKLNAHLLAFNVDPEFNDSVDSLMVVDLTRVEPRLLSHYLGKLGSAEYLERHRRLSDETVDGEPTTVSSGIHGPD